MKKNLLVIAIFQVLTVFPSFSADMACKDDCPPGSGRVVREIIKANEAANSSDFSKEITFNGKVYTLANKVDLSMINPENENDIYIRFFPSLVTHQSHTTSSEYHVVNGEVLKNEQQTIIKSESTLPHLCLDLDEHPYSSVKVIINPTNKEK